MVVGLVLVAPRLIAGRLLSGFASLRSLTRTIPVARWCGNIVRRWRWSLTRDVRSRCLRRPSRPSPSDDTFARSSGLASEVIGRNRMESQASPVPPRAARSALRLAMGTAPEHRPPVAAVFFWRGATPVPSRLGATRPAAAPPDLPRPPGLCRPVPSALVGPDGTSPVFNGVAPLP